jgi:hypothetical protein
MLPLAKHEGLLISKYASTAKMSIKATNTNPILAFKFPYPGLNVYGATKDHMVLTAADTERAAARVSVRRTEG